MSTRVVRNIEKLLDERGWSKRKLACNMSMPQKRLERVMRGEESPSRKKIKRIADAFGVSFLQLHRPVESKQKTEQTYTIKNDGTLVWN